MFVVTCSAPVNIALIKYWGKRDEELILPINDSLSMTLNTNEMCATTTAASASTFKSHTMWLNGEEVPFEENPRIVRCLKELQRLALARGGGPKFPIDWKLHIASRNNFPTAAGLASSAAGYACLVYTLACLYGVNDDTELSAIARQGSGSACRSIYGGFVRWHAGIERSGIDSVAHPIAPASHWPEMHVLILVVNDERKKTSSTKGMQRAVETSALIQHRAREVVPARIATIEAAIERRDFATFAELTMKDSNQFHAVALDTFPPCVYMNDVSHAIAAWVHAYNELDGVKVAYTYDAGPNACLYLLEADVPAVLGALHSSFPNDASNSVEYVKGIPVELVKQESNNGLNQNATLPSYAHNLLKYIIHTKVGDGPKQLDKEASLLNLSDGLLLTQNVN